MALFQPTFVTPDASWGVGNGTIDATKPLDVSWQVNGNSAMVAYQIDFYENDSTSTLLHSTGRVALSEPYYGTNAKGELNPFFTVTFSASDIASWGIENGEEYKLVITQWWGATDYVAQTSASAFIARNDPVIALTNVPTSLGRRDNTFTATFTGDAGVDIEYVRWTLSTNDGSESSIIYDSQNIYGTAELSFYYNGFFNGSSYTVAVEAMASTGKDCSDEASFAVSYETNEMSGFVTVSKACNASAVHVDWSDLFTTTGTATGDYTIANDQLFLPTGSSVLWNSRNGNPLSYETPWGIAFSGTLQSKDATLFTAAQSGGALTLQFVKASNSLVLKKGSTTVKTLTNIYPIAHLNVAVTASKIYVRQDYMVGGLTPSNTLAPSGSLAPRDNTVPANVVTEEAITYTQSEITSMEIGGEILCDYLLVSRGALSQTIIADMMSRADYAPPVGAQNNFYATFAETLDAGSLSIGNDSVVGYDVYRLADGESRLLHVGRISVDDTGFYDYGARAEQGPYTYYIFPQGETTYVTEPIPSGKINPCFWDWTLLECEQDDTDANIYHALNAYNFGKNLISGAITNGSTPSQFQTFTKYPLIQPSTSFFQSGTLTSMIGEIKYDDTHSGYYDTKEMRDDIWALALNRNPKFLKSRKGDLLRVEINGEITMETMDESRTQAQTVQLPWAEVGDASEVSIISAKIV